MPLLKDHAPGSRGLFWTLNITYYLCPHSKVSSWQPRFYFSVISNYECTPLKSFPIWGAQSISDSKSQRHLHPLGSQKVQVRCMSSHTEFSTPEEKRTLHFLPGAAGQQGTGDSALLLERFILVSVKKNVRCTVLPSSKFNSENCPRESNWRLFITPIMHSSELEFSPTPVILSTVFMGDSFCLFLFGDRVSCCTSWGRLPTPDCPSVLHESYDCRCVSSC